jgi:hypothetical protein
MTDTSQQIYPLIVLGSSGTSDTDKWTTFLNADPQLKAEVLAIQPDNTFVAWPNETWTIEEYDGDEVKCSQGRNIKYFKREDVEEYQREQVKEKRNTSLNVFQKFFQIHGPLYREQTYKRDDYQIHKVDVLLSGNTPKPGEMAFSGIMENEYEFVDSDSEITLKFKEHGNIAFMHFDDDGNFYNRDYNVKIQEFTQTKPDLQIFLQKFRDSVKALGPLQVSQKSDTLYGEDFCYIPWSETDQWGSEFELKKIPRRPGFSGYTYQRWKGESIIKKPTTVVTLSPEEVVKMLEEKFLADLLTKF